MNTNLYKLITHYESLHDGDLTKVGLQPKMDPVGIWTEGWGHAIYNNGQFVKGLINKDLASKLSIIHTIDDADKQLELDLRPIFTIIARKITIKLNDNQLAALVSFIYNTGGSSTLYNLINTNSKDLYNWWTTHYITAQGVKLKGLEYRRKTEALLFTTETLKFFN